MSLDNQRANVHILISPSIHPKQFRLAVNRLQCSEMHFFSNSVDTFTLWEEECDHMGIFFHKHKLASNQVDMLEDIYNVGELVANRNIFLCLNSEQQLLCNMITQFITLELRHNHEDSELKYFNNIGCFYEIFQSSILLAPIYPHWDPDCQLVIESLTSSGEGMTKKQLLEHIEVVQEENFSEDKLNRALKKIEQWLDGFYGFIKERRETRAYVYELRMLVEL